MKNRSYNQLCGLAFALDLVGERWTLLLIRELVAGPRRFTDLIAGLPGVSTNLLSERLKHLEQNGIISRRILPPPAASMVYELTKLGEGLEPMLVELGRWGSQFVPIHAEDAILLHVGSYALTLKTFFRPEEAQGVNETYALHIDNEVQQVTISDGTLQVQQGETRPARVRLTTDMPTYMALLGGELQPEAAVAAGVIHVSGDMNALRRFLHICGLPNLQPA